jgi:hypothetical protein
MDRKTRRYEISEKFIFSWLPPKNTARTLFAFLTFSCAIHFLGFYLFNVVYPSGIRKELHPNQITLLDTNDPEVQNFLERAYDRGVFLLPPSHNSSAQVRISDYSINFVPSFAEARPTLKETKVNDLNDRFTVSPPKIQEGISAWTNPVELSPNLFKRGLAPNTILDHYLSLIPHLPPLKLNLTVNPDGHPTVKEPEMDENQKQLARIIESTLRFKPVASSQGDDPGWIKMGESPKPAQ